MKLLEATAKSLLAEGGLRVPVGELASSAADAAAIAERLGPCVVKAQVPAGGRGKAGGVVLCTTPAEAEVATSTLIGTLLGDHRVDEVLVEQQIDIDTELYLAFMIDTSAGMPMVVFNQEGGVDIEDNLGSLERRHLTPGAAIGSDMLDSVCHGLGVDGLDVRAAIEGLHKVFTSTKATLVEVNPLVVASDASIIALDAKIETDDSAPRVVDEVADDAGELTPLEQEAAEKGLRLIELGGNVAILANGAGLTMTTMDAVAHHGGQPANFLEIGGDAYTRAESALDLTLRQTGVGSLVVNFCGAFARCDVMTEGVVNAWLALSPDIEVFFSIHGTGQDEARAMVREQLGIEQYESMDDAIIAAVSSARLREHATQDGDEL